MSDDQILKTRLPTSCGFLPYQYGKPVTLCEALTNSETRLHFEWTHGLSFEDLKRVMELVMRRVLSIKTAHGVTDCADERLSHLTCMWVEVCSRLSRIGAISSWEHCDPFTRSSTYEWIHVDADIDPTITDLENGVEYWGRRVIRLVTKSMKRRRRRKKTRANARKSV
jgi:hypothetical protein